MRVVNISRFAHTIIVQDVSGVQKTLTLMPGVQIFPEGTTVPLDHAVYYKNFLFAVTENGSVVPLEGSPSPDGSGTVSESESESPAEDESEEDESESEEEEDE